LTKNVAEVISATSLSGGFIISSSIFEGSSMHCTVHKMLLSDEYKNNCQHILSYELLMLPKYEYN